MFSRFFTAAIILFWVTMMALLMRSELWPDQSALRAVPIEKVAKLMWFHREPSELVIWSDGQRVGHLRLHPKVRESDGARVLEYSGNVRVHFPGTPPRIHAKRRTPWANASPNISSACCSTPRR